jgi:hypothetical protein
VSRIRTVLVGVGLLLSCKGTPEQSAPPASTSASSSAQAAAVPSAAAKAWYEGAWQGTYQAELQKLETAAGGPKAWKEDDGSKASGEGKLSLEAAADGTVTGSATGPLGEHTVSGKIEGEHVALTLVPVQPDGFRGVILASQKESAIAGNLSASSGDSLVARRGAVSLSRAAK